MPGTGGEKNRKTVLNAAVALKGIHHVRSHLSRIEEQIVRGSKYLSLISSFCGISQEAAHCEAAKFLCNVNVSM